MDRWIDRSIDRGCRPFRSGIRSIERVDRSLGRGTACVDGRTTHRVETRRSVPPVTSPPPAPTTRSTSTTRRGSFDSFARGSPSRDVDADGRRARATDGRARRTDGRTDGDGGGDGLARDVSRGRAFTHSFIRTGPPRIGRGAWRRWRWRPITTARGVPRGRRRA